MEAMKTTTAIVNSTNDVLKLKVGGNQHYAELASIDKEGQYDLQVNVNETYREFQLQGVGDSSGKTVIVNSDDCCDNECITIKEADHTGKFEVHRVPRQQSQYISGQASEVVTSSDSEVKLNPTSTWFGWLRQLLY